MGKPENLLHKPNNAGRGLSALELCLEAHAMCQTMIQFDRPSDPEKVCREYLNDCYSTKEGVYCLTDRIPNALLSWFSMTRTRAMRTIWIMPQRMRPAFKNCGDFTSCR